MERMMSLDDLLPSCTVRVDVPGIGNGTGFFVAPGLVVTCAHVIASARLTGGTVTVRWQGASYPVEIEAVVPEPVDPMPPHYPYPDLALLRVAIREHPVVRLDARAPIPGDQMYSYGYPDNYPSGDSALLDYEGPAGEDEPNLRLKDAQVRPGMSGAPLLNRRTGGICGVVNKSRGRDLSMGARGIPGATVLRAMPRLVNDQRDWHAQNRTWLDQMSPQQRRLAGWREPLDALELAVRLRLKRFDDEILAEAFDKVDPEAGAAPAMELPVALARLLLSTDLMSLWGVVEVLSGQSVELAGEVYEIVAPFTWVDLSATKLLNTLVLEAHRRAVAINTREQETAIMYVRCAGRNHPFPRSWRLGVAKRPQGESTPEIIASTIGATLRELVHWREGDPPEDFRYALSRSVVFLVIPFPLPDRKVFDRLRSEFPEVAFVLLAGASGRQGLSELAEVEYLVPELDPDMETDALREYRWAIKSLAPSG